MALDQQQFQLHYQPQARTADGRILGVEALIRWHRPDIGMVPPDMFIPLAEESGLIVPIGEWVLREACRQIQQWRQQGTPLRVAVNFSAYQFRQPNLVECVARALHDTELPPELFEVEVTETALMQDTNIARSILSDLHNLGVSIALDDFGTGYSSLSYLKQFPVDLLKIDRAFISDLPTDQDDAAIVRAIIALAEKLGLKVIAEGVETKEQMIFLRNAGCDMFQGYYLQRPVPADQLFKFFNDSSRS
jgi:EAL domain-containing protein (putative c-di-GMP-specific phosphodiesterase class I)